MSKPLSICCLILVLFSSCWNHQQVLLKESTSSLYAFTHAEVIPIRPRGILHDHTLIVKDGVIQALGPSDEVKTPPNARIISLKGQYVLPGFSDMHVHLTRHKELLQFLKNGVTRLRNMAASDSLNYALGVPHIPSLKPKIQKGQVLGPSLTGCGPFLDGYPPQNGITTPVHNDAQARKVVRFTLKEGYDCVKTYNQLKKTQFEAATHEAWKHDLPLMGHVPHSVSLYEALKAPVRTIEHLNAYVDNFAGTYRIPPESWAEAVQKTAAAEVYNCPTLVIWDRHPRYQQFEAIEKDPRFRNLSPVMQYFWRDSMDTLFDVTYPDKAGYPQHILELSKPVVKALYEGGAPLLIGTDANLTGIYPGESTLREMELFAEAGVPPEGILEAATLNAAAVLHLEKEEGTLAPGQRAQMVVLRENPLEDIRAVRTTVGVMVQGRWWTVEALDKILQGL